MLLFICCLVYGHLITCTLNSLGLACLEKLVYLYCYVALVNWICVFGLKIRVKAKYYPEFCGFCFDAID